MTVFFRGARVYDEADPRHIGIIKMISLSEQTATIHWEETGWLSFRVPLGGLRIAERENGTQQL